MYISHKVLLARICPVDCMRWLSSFVCLWVLVSLDAREIFRAAVTIVAMLVTREQHSEGVTHSHFTIERFI